jgi:hypothetical protein
MNAPDWQIRRKLRPLIIPSHARLTSALTRQAGFGELMVSAHRQADRVLTFCQNEGTL